MIDHNKTLETSLNELLFNQERAISMVVEALSKSDFISQKKLFRALFTFMGPANSGKHFLGQKLVELDDELETIKVFHMDWYAESDEGKASIQIEAEIINYIAANPRTLLVFEDIEKAELQVQLTIFALLTDKTNSKVDFSQTVVIFTTTRAASFIAQNDFKRLYAEDTFVAQSYLIERLAKEEVVLEGMIEQAFDKKLLSLINENSVVLFNKLSLASLIKIGARALHDMSQNFLHKSSIDIEYIGFDKVASLLTLSMTPYLNAKYIKEKLPETMFRHIYKGIKLLDDVKTVRCCVSKEAQEFCDEALRDEEKLLKQLRDQHQRVSLSWDYKVEDGVVMCEITKVAYANEVIKVSTESSFSASLVDFDDIAGHQKVKKELLEIADLLKDSSRLKRFGMTLPKGIVLHGPANIGKKMLARAFAKELDMPYLSISQSELFDENKIAEVYTKARQVSPSIVILEDIDIQGILGGNISAVSVAPFIDQLDALPPSLEPIVFTIATLALINPIQEPLIATGYLNMTIEVPKLDKEARRFFIEQVLTMPNDGKIDVDKVVRYISGMDGKELQKIANDAALFAVRKGKDFLTQEMLLEQINVIKYGSKLENKQMRDIEKSMETTAFHEAGHAVLSYFLMPDTKIEQVTVAPRSDALGFVSYNNEDYVDAISKDDMFHNICVLLAGRTVTMHKYGPDGLESGAVNDLEVASLQIYAAIAIFGMDEELANLSISGIEMGYSKELFSKKIESRMLVWLKEAQEKTQVEVEKHWTAITAVAKALIENEVIDGVELKDIIEGSS